MISRVVLVVIFTLQLVQGLYENAPGVAMDYKVKFDTKDGIVV